MGGSRRRGGELSSGSMRGSRSDATGEDPQQLAPSLSDSRELDPTND